MKILIVEDNEINAKVLDLMLKKLEFKYSTDFAENADRALSIAEEEMFDLILMDINLGDGQMTGTEVMKALKAQDSYRNVPIYAVTCYSLPGDRERFLEAGFDKYISKPIDQNMLINEVHGEKERINGMYSVLERSKVDNVRANTRKESKEA